MPSNSNQVLAKKGLRWRTGEGASLTCFDQVNTVLPLVFMPFAIKIGKMNGQLML